ncbi:MAG: hypothetical protein RI988_2954 [Pseudomonadota bacterium]|jgi:tRNA 5-methylaminomethyl-2-thiouridine biosynthesis bifunctional protein
MSGVAGTPGGLAPAELEFDDGTPRSRTYGDLYHPREGALGQARHVFLGGNALPGRWQGRDDFVVLETGFGLGHNFLATWAAWRDDPHRCTTLHVMSIEAHPVDADLLRRAHASSALRPLAEALAQAWPQPVAGLHLLEFEGSAVRLWLALGDVQALLPKLRARVDAFYLDGFAPARNPRMWEPAVFAGAARLAAPDATAATWSAARVVRDGLEGAGFAVQAADGFGHKRDMTLARFQPRGPHHPAAGRHAAPRPRSSAVAGTRGEALVIGAGLAGAAAARALAKAGWHCTVLERADESGTQASGNPAGIFHGSQGRSDHRHAQLLAAAARLAAGRYREWVDAQGQGNGAVHGLDHDGHFDPLGGWLRPRELVSSWLATAGVELHTGQDVQRLIEQDGRWHARDARGHAIAQGDITVLAGGAALEELLQRAGGAPLLTHPVRGQVSWVQAESGLQRPKAGQGYAVPLPEGALLFGATAQAEDMDPGLRTSDHHYNLRRLRELTGTSLADDLPWTGRVGWRCVALDRLPVVGAVPDPAPLTPPLPARTGRVPRLAGLYVLGALGSRGLTWAPLLGELLRAWVDGTPMPLTGDQVDALDPARVVLRRARKASSV